MFEGCNFAPMSARAIPIRTHIKGGIATFEFADDKTGWFSTHPGTSDRRSSVEAHAKELGWKP